jgi:hypothetical protein
VLIHSVVHKNTTLCSDGGFVTRRAVTAFSRLEMPQTALLPSRQAPAAFRRAATHQALSPAPHGYTARGSAASGWVKPLRGQRGLTNPRLKTRFAVHSLSVEANR